MIEFTRFPKLTPSRAVKVLHQQQRAQNRDESEDLLYVKVIEQSIITKTCKMYANQPIERQCKHQDYGRFRKKQVKEILQICTKRM